MAGTHIFQSKLLTKRSPEEYRVYQAGLEWDLTEPIVMESADDFKSARRWQERLTPYNHQVNNLMTFCRRLPVTLLADDVGLGKTISAGLIISELIARSRLSKILIVCPKLLGPQWKAELSEKFDISAEVVIGKDLMYADPEEMGAIITTYNSARLYLDQIPEDRFQMLILDEAHKLRNLYGTDNAPQVAKCFRKALEERRFRFVLMLTATPIQNRLWDLYSLVDLLTVARGHQNPFGSTGSFATRFIADKRDQARQLKEEAREDFRSIVYGYMSRIRRGDANLLFPDRIVQMHKVDPTEAELKLIKTIAGPIQKLNRLAQISILQALTSSPQALNLQLSNMAQKGTVPQELASAVKSIVSSMPQSAKLNGLGRLIEALKKENPNGWRLVVFTGRRETQTTIETFLTEYGLKVGTINGDSGERNQETIARFRKNPPDLRVIVSTEAGSEGVNLQVANVLVNYDLPWNPMIVEQRIGRIQRLASDHANVSIFNIMLRGTFEEYIVGRLMEKLQMASHAIGDIEALLQGSVGDGDDDNFEDKILDLVLSALAGKDYERDTRLMEQSIQDAKTTFEKEEQNINQLLGSMDGAEYVGPRAPNLPSVIRSMEAQEFVLAALQKLGARITPHSNNVYLIEENGGRAYIRFEEKPSETVKSTLYTPGSAAFQRLISRIITTGVHDVVDIDKNPINDSQNLIQKWTEDFEGKIRKCEPLGARRRFNGEAILRVRATVAHDSYERLVNVNCLPKEQTTNPRSALLPLANSIEDPIALGIDTDQLVEAAHLDEAIAEFSRFYIERRTQETNSAGTDERKRQKLYDEFTPRIDVTLVGLKGDLSREIKMRVQYNLESEENYESVLIVNPSNSSIIDAPELAHCKKTGKRAPISCLEKCEITKDKVLRHLLAESEISNRLALPEHIIICAHTGKRILKDEAEVSSITGKQIIKTLLRTSALSGKRAEPEYFGECTFTNLELLKTELANSEISGRLYRLDEQKQSIFSGKKGHKDEFIDCYETRKPIALIEAEKCEATGNLVRPGILVGCDETGKRVLPSELEQCSISNKRVLKPLLVASSISNTRLLPAAAVKSSTGKYCTPFEARSCFWSGNKYHPDDLRVCDLSGLTIHLEFATSNDPPCLIPLIDTLAGLVRTADKSELWENIGVRLNQELKGGKCRVEAAVLSPSSKYVAGSSEVKTLLGLKTQQIGFVYSIADGAIAGRLAKGKRNQKGWLAVDGK